MLASQLIQALGLKVSLKTDLTITSIQLDSRKVGPGCLFLALQGSSTDGSRYIPQALEKGASLVFTDSSKAVEDTSVCYVPDLRRQVSRLMNAFLGDPLKHLQCVGITGTNGKTTVSRLTSSLFTNRGHKVICLGTIDNRIGAQVLPSRLTTPDPVELMELIGKGVHQGCDVLVLEASSHALDQDRVSAIPFARAVFTNLTQDHLDYHKDFEDYYQAKKKLFSEFLDADDGVAVINADSPYGQRLMQELNCRIVSFSQKPNSPTAGEINLSLVRSDLSLKQTRLWVAYQGSEYEFISSLLGKINLENLLAVIALGFSLGISYESIKSGIRDVKVEGRNELIRLPGGRMALVDYAHTPDALERVLASVRPLVKGRLLCVFGCGGDRDKTKRPLMGGIASKLSDIAIVTSDNPRTEDPQAIIQDILAGIEDRNKVEVIPDRAKAINHCLESLQPGDCGVVAGKGHEDYQIIGQNRNHFSDREQIQGWMDQTKLEH